MINEWNDVMNEPSHAQQRVVSMWLHFIKFPDGCTQIHMPSFRTIEKAYIANLEHKSLAQYTPVTNSDIAHFVDCVEVPSAIELKNVSK